MRMMNALVLAAAIAVALSAAGSYAQNANQHEHAAPAAAQAPAMDHQAMMAAMQADQKKLDELVAQMNAARGEDKIDKNRCRRHRARRRERRR
jgi:hypothetical protein